MIIPVLAVFVTEIMKAFREFAPASWQARLKDHQLQSLLQIKLHFSSSLSEEKKSEIF